MIGSRQSIDEDGFAGFLTLTENAWLWAAVSLIAFAWVAAGATLYSAFLG